MANTYNDYTGDGSNRYFNLNFEYLRDDHVKVKVDGSEVGFVINTDLPTKRVYLNTAPANGAKVKVYRDSRGDFEPIADFVDGSVLTGDDLDEAYLHNLYVAQETSQGVGGELLFKKNGVDYDAEGNKIINLGTPTDSTDAANKGYVDQTIDNSIALGGSPAIVSLGGYDVTALGTSITRSLADWTNDLATGDLEVTATGSTTARSLSDRFADVINVLDYGAKGDGVTDDTNAIQAAINAGRDSSSQVFFPSGNYLVSSGLTIYKGSNLLGINQTQGHASYASGYVGSKITFAPTTVTDLFTLVNLPLPAQEFKGEVSISGLFIDGNTISGGTNSRYAFVLPVCIYGSFNNLEIRYFQSGFNLSDTINNHFENIRVANTTGSCVEYSGDAPPTTDVWQQCTFTDSRIGVRLVSGIAIRFVNCLFENLSEFGANIAKECSHIEFTGCYSENITDSVLGGSMFYVGNLGDTPTGNTSLIINGGKYGGNNLSILPVGQFLHADNISGVLISNVAVMLFATALLTTTNTQVGAITISGLQTYNCTTIYNDKTKLTGFFGYQSVQSPGGQIARFDGIDVGSNTSAVNGMFTATLTSATPPTSPPTTTAHYNVLGNKVTITAEFLNVDTSGGAGEISITGLPIACGSYSCHGVVAINGFGAAPLMATVAAGSTTIKIRDMVTTVYSNMTAGTGKYMLIQVTYFTS